MAKRAGIPSIHPVYAGGIGRYKLLDPLGELSSDLPDEITLVFEDKLLIEVSCAGSPLPRDAWSYDADQHWLNWAVKSKSAEHFGNLQFLAAGLKGFGTIGNGRISHAVFADLPPVTYLCDVALNTGAYVKGHPPALQLVFNTQDPRWNSASWQKGVLEFTYQMQEQIIVGQTYYDFYLNFQDLQTSTVWTPTPDSFGCIVDENFVFNMMIVSGAPSRDGRTGLPPPSNQIQTVFPYRFSFQLSPTAQGLTGAALTVVDAPNGVVLGVRGAVLQTPHGQNRALAPAPSPGAQTVSGMPASPASVLKLATLMLMTPFRFVDGGWCDVVQQSVIADMNSILLYFMPGELRRTYWNCDQPTLSSDLQQIAVLAPPGENPGQWYASLAVAFLSNVMASWSTPGADLLNAVRARAWMSRQAAQSGVYALQAPALYQLEWGKLWPEINDFIVDQKTNQSNYDAFIRSDADLWIENIQKNTADPELLAQSLAMIRNLSQTAQENGLYWAYAYFRNATAPAQIARLTLLAVGADSDSTAYMRRIQSDAVVLSALDPSGLFIDQYYNSVNIGLFCNLVPTLADYSHLGPDLSANVKEVLSGLASTYGGSSDPVIAQIAQQAEALAARSDLATLVSSAQQAAGALPDGSDWALASLAMTRALTPVVGKDQANLLCACLPALVAGGLVGGDQAVNDGNAEAGLGLSPGAIISATKYTLQIIYGVAKWGVALSASLQSYGSTWAALKGLFTADMLARANLNVDAGLRQWMIDNGVVSVESEMFGNLFAEAPSSAQRAAVAVFGRNLDEFMALRVGAVFALASLIAGAVAVSKSQDQSDEIVNGLSVTSSSLALIATAGQWALTSFGVTEIGGIAVSTLCSIIGALSIVAAAAGVVLMLYFWFKSKPTPVQTFAETYGAQAGLYMPFTSEIDYFTGYSNVGQIARIGVAFAPATSSHQTLLVSSDGAAALGALDYNFDTVFCVDTDALGVSRVRAMVPTDVGYQSRWLGVRANGSIGFDLLAADDPKAQAAQAWTIRLTKAPSRDGAFPEHGPFELKRADSDAWLAWTSDGLSLTDRPQIWVLTQTPMAVAGLTIRDIHLRESSAGVVAYPVLKQWGSAPRTWTVAPPLPPFLSLDASTGAISQTEAPPTPVVDTPYVLSATNAVTPAPALASFQIFVS